MHLNPRFLFQLAAALLFSSAGSHVLRAADVASPTTSANGYMGDESCVACHQEKVSTYHQTAHYFTSQWPTGASIKGSFHSRSNVLKTSNTNLFFKMEATDKGFFQTGALWSSPSGPIHRTERFGVVVGSGRKGQTYLYWERDELFQLPVSYWTELNEWVNSPGFDDGTAIFDRPITPRCLECHASSFQSLAPPISRYKESSLVLGITCEKCHGPAREHIARYRSVNPPKVPTDGAIINPARLGRDRQMDACALCHASGSSRPQVPALSFVPGDDLNKFVDLPKPADGKVDVHGGHVQLLEQSRCFKSSANMTCTTCHQVHAPQRNATDFAAKCLACHKVETCGQFAKLGHAIDRQCVECHMPLQATSLIVCSAKGKRLQPQMRNHKIAIYPGVTLPAAGNAAGSR
jgi:cytochrome c554/c'-like protein